MFSIDIEKKGGAPVGDLGSRFAAREFLISSLRLKSELVPIEARYRRQDEADETDEIDRLAK